MLKKIVILGPESTGKSNLCQQLADQYNTLWCPEYARKYLLKNGTNYNYDDLLHIAKGQLKLEDEYAQSLIGRLDSHSPGPLGSQPFPLFIDTNMYVMKVWCEFVFDKCHPYIMDQIAERKYDLYLLCNTDLPWVKDELREYPDAETRQKLFLIYKELLINQAVPWKEISGNYHERLQTAIRAVDKLMS